MANARRTLCYTALVTESRKRVLLIAGVHSGCTQIGADRPAMPGNQIPGQFSSGTEFNGTANFQVLHYPAEFVEFLPPENTKS